MPLASSSRSNLRYAKEATFGAVAAGTGRRLIRNTGSSFKYSLAFDKSKEIRSDRQTSDHILLGASAGGGLNFELCYREYDELMAATLQGAIVAFNATGVSPTLTTPTFAANTLTQTAGTSFVTIQKGQWLSIAGCTSTFAVNNRVLQVSLTVSPTATLITFEGSPGLTVGAASGTVTIRTSRVQNGIVQSSFSVEPEYNDLPQFQTLLGMVPNKLSFNFTSKAIATGSIDFMGAGGLALTGTSNLVGTDDVLFPTTNDVMNCTSNVASILEANAALTGGAFVKSISFDVDNALAGQDAVANLNVVGIRSGRLSITGKMSVYFVDATMYNKFFSNTNSSVAVQVKDAANNGYVITLPAIEYTDSGLQVGSLDQDIMVDLTFAAKIDTLSGKMISIDRFGA